MRPCKVTGAMLAGQSSAAAEGTVQHCSRAGCAAPCNGTLQNNHLPEGLLEGALQVVAIDLHQCLRGPTPIPHVQAWSAGW